MQEPHANRQCEAWLADYPVIAERAARYFAAFAGGEPPAEVLGGVVGLLERRVVPCRPSKRASSIDLGMSFDHLISEVVKVVEAVGAGIMVLGGLAAFLVFAFRAVRPATARESYDELRRTLGRCILVGLEVLIIADIVRTIIVDPTLESVAVLGIIVVIRIALSFSLEVEIDGFWPWRRWQLTRSVDAQAPPESS